MTAPREHPDPAINAVATYFANELPDLRSRIGIARDVIGALRELPVADRMEAMGMRPEFIGADSWYEVE